MKDDIMVPAVGKAKTFSKTSCHHFLVVITTADLYCVFTGLLYPSLGTVIFVVVEDDCSFVANKV